MRRLAAELVYLVQTIGYWIRPYDALADCRRWFWRPRTRCRPIVIDTTDPVWRSWMREIKPTCGSATWPPAREIEEPE